MSTPPVLSSHQEAPGCSQHGQGGLQASLLFLGTPGLILGLALHTQKGLVTQIQLPVSEGSPGLLETSPHSKYSCKTYIPLLQALSCWITWLHIREK